MSGLRVGVAVPGATTSELLRIARVAEHWNIGTLWIGDPDGAAANSLDSYVTTAAAAVAATTTHLRIGVFLGLDSELQVLRIAEDVAVVDQSSGGRVELGLRPPQDELGQWTDRAVRFLRAWNAWSITGSEEIVPVVPGLLQPVLPRLVVGGGAAADVLLAGRLVDDDAAPDARPVPPRTVLRHAMPGDVEAWLAPDPLQVVQDLRAAARRTGAQDMLLVATATPGDDELRSIGTVLCTSLRAADRDAMSVAGDAWVWLHQRGHLHEPQPAGVTGASP